MNKIFNKKNSIILLTFIIIDIIAIGGWILYFEPSDDMTIALIFIIPALFLANLVLAGIIYFVKKYYTPFFVLNAFISSVLIFYFWGWYIKVETIRNWEEWDFHIGDMQYYILFAKNYEEHLYGVYYRPDSHSSWGDDRGTFEIKNDTVFFNSVDSASYYIYRDTLYNFKEIEKIKVKKKY